jgi:ABC-type transport system involved in multi-copper enzyme maturation permease subunit
VIAQLRAEVFKLATTRTARTLLVALVGLSLLVVCLHVFALGAADLSQAVNQPKIFGWGTTLGTLFGALTGAIGVTSEFRYGTIRTTLLASPDRSRLVAAKAGAAALGGLLVGLLAAGLVAAIGSAGLALRGIPITLSGGDFARMLAGGAVAAALWAVIGTGLGALVRGQIVAVAGLCVWLLLIENILVGNVASAGKYAPGASAGALTGLTPNGGAATLLTPGLGALLLAGYAATAALFGATGLTRRDIN